MSDVTVVIPTRDRRALLDLTLRSVLRQRDVDVRVVVVDDGSTDGTSEKVAELGDPRVHVVRHDRARGVSAARNAGVAAARGTWVAFLDDDDLWAPDKLAAQVAAAERDERDWAVSGAVCVDSRLTALVGEPTLPAEQIAADIGRVNSVPVGASNVLVRASLLEAAGAFDEGLRHMSDWDLWIRLAKAGLPSTVNQPHVAYRLHASSATMDTGHDAAEPLAELEVIANRYGIPADRAAVHRWIGWSAMRAGRRRAAVNAYCQAVREGDRTSALRVLLAAVHPGSGKQIFYTPLARRGQDTAWLGQAQVWLHDLERA